MRKLAIAGLVLVPVALAAFAAAIDLARYEQGPTSANAAVPSISSVSSSEANHLGRIVLPEGRSEDEGAETVLVWSDLVPEPGTGRPVSLEGGTAAREGMPTRAEFDDGITDEDLAEFVREIDEMRSLQEAGGAVREDLDGVRVRIAGYVTPIGFDPDRISEFLLVPWLGACIHTPPPAANQIVYVDGASGLTPEMMYDPIWVTGVLRAAPSATVLADVGYRLEDVRVERYDPAPGEGAA